ncbi:MAG: hypothetical protein QF824_03075 [Candidatus Woesearchaeota archaeon]|jgi:hypothetical protein|nr:hypothetical protein [Candidatus Woesearchaeota archaeon]
MRKKRGAIGLSLNFIVIIVISVAVLVLGFAFIKKIYTGSTNIQEDYYRQFESKMEGLACDDTDRVCVGKNRKQINKQGSVVFTMRVLNIGVSGGSFTVDVGCTDFLPKDGSSGFCPTGDQIVPSLAGTYSIPENEAEKFPIAISLSGRESGTYIFEARVNQYPPEDKIQLTAVVP